MHETIVVSKKLETFVKWGPDVDPMKYGRLWSSLALPKPSKTNQNNAEQQNLVRTNILRLGLLPITK